MAIEQDQNDNSNLNESKLTESEPIKVLSLSNRFKEIEIQVEEQIDELRYLCKYGGIEITTICQE